MTESIINIPNTGGTSQWIKLGTLTIGQGGKSAFVKIISNNGYSASTIQNFEVYLRFKTSDGSSINSDGFAADSSFYITGENTSIGPNSIKWVGNAAGINATAYDLYVNFGANTGSNSFYTVETSSGSWTNAGSLGQTDPGNNSSTVLAATFEMVESAPLTIPCTAPSLTNFQLMAEIYGWYTDANGITHWEPQYSGTAQYSNSRPDGVPSFLPGSGYLAFKNNLSNPTYANLFTITSSDNSNSALLCTDQGFVVKKDIEAGGALFVSQGAVLLGHGLINNSDPPKISLTHSDPSPNFAPSGSSMPTSPTPNMLFYNTTLGGLYQYKNGNWVLYSYPINYYGSSLSQFYYWNGSSSSSAIGSTLPGSGTEDQCYIVTGIPTVLYQWHNGTWISLGSVENWNGGYDTLHITRSDGITPAHLDLGNLTVHGDINVDGSIVSLADHLTGILDSSLRILNGFLGFNPSHAPSFAGLSVSGQTSLGVLAVSAPSGQGITLDFGNIISMNAGTLILDNGDNKAGYIQFGQTLSSTARLAQVNISGQNLPVLAVQSYVGSGGKYGAWDLGILDASAIFVDHINSASAGGIYLFDDLRLWGPTTGHKLYDSTNSAPANYFLSTNANGYPVWVPSSATWNGGTVTGDITINKASPILALQDSSNNGRIKIVPSNGNCYIECGLQDTTGSTAQLLFTTMNAQTTLMTLDTSGSLTIAGSIANTADTNSVFLMNRYNNSSGPYSYYKLGAGSSGFIWANNAFTTNLMILDTNGYLTATRMYATFVSNNYASNGASVFCDISAGNKWVFRTSGGVWGLYINDDGTMGTASNISSGGVYQIGSATVIQRYASTATAIGVGDNGYFYDDGSVILGKNDYSKTITVRGGLVSRYNTLDDGTGFLATAGDIRCQGTLTVWQNIACSGAISLGSSNYLLWGTDTYISRPSAGCLSINDGSGALGALNVSDLFADFINSASGGDLRPCKTLRMYDSSSNNIMPYSNNVGNIGGNGVGPNWYWGSVWANYLKYHTSNSSFDAYDDIDIVRKMKTKKDEESGKDVIDENTLKHLQDDHGFYDVAHMNGWHLSLQRRFVEKHDEHDREIASLKSQLVELQSQLARLTAKGGVSA